MTLRVRAGMMPRMSPLRLLSVIALCAALLAACGKPALPTAPLGDHAALEQLAEAYRQTLQEVPTAPRAMRPAGRLMFVEQVFRGAGYDYAATLAALAEGLDAGDKNQRDLAELVSQPFSGLSDAGLDELLSGDMLENARQLRQRLKQ